MIERNQTAGHYLRFYHFNLGSHYVSTKLLADFAPLEILFFRFVMGYFCLLLIYLSAQGKTADFQVRKLFLLLPDFSGVTSIFIEKTFQLTRLASNVGVIAVVWPLLLPRS